MGLKVSEPAVHLCLQLVRYCDRLRHSGNALPDELDQPDTLGDGQLKDLGHRKGFHEVKATTRLSVATLGEGWKGPQKGRL